MYLDVAVLNSGIVGAKAESLGKTEVADVKANRPFQIAHVKNRSPLRSSSLLSPVRNQGRILLARTGQFRNGADALQVLRERAKAGIVKVRAFSLDEPAGEVIEPPVRGFVILGCVLAQKDSIPRPIAHEPRDEPEPCSHPSIELFLGRMRPANGQHRSGERFKIGLLPLALDTQPREKPTFSGFKLQIRCIGT